jgi:enoyl-CoA hydratase/carnithine racemase
MKFNYTGEYLNAAQAEKIGLVDAVIQLEEISDIIEGVKPTPEIGKNKKILDEKYSPIQKYFEKYSLSEILETENDKDGFQTDTFLKLSGKIKKKAPLALQTSEKLIDEGRGCESELEELTNIFQLQMPSWGLAHRKECRVSREVKFLIPFFMPVSSSSTA